MSKNSSKNLLDHYKIQSPCHEDWDGMLEEQRGRFCQSCDKSVHDLSNMTQNEAFSFLEKTPSPCVRYTIGQDGAVQFLSPATSGRPSELVGRWREYMARSAVVASLLLAGCDDLTSSNSATRTEFVDSSNSSADPGLTQDTIDQNAASSLEGSTPEKTGQILMGEVEPIVMGKIKVIAPAPRFEMGDIAPIPDDED